MNKFLPFFVLLCVTTLFAQNRVIAYFPHWAQYSQFTPKDVRYDLLTDIRYGYLTPSGSDLLFADESDKDNFLALVSQAKAAKVKLTVAVGGLGSEAAMKEAYESKNFAEAIKKFQNEYKVDAFELDGGAISAEDLPKLLKQAANLANAGITVSIAIPGTESLASAVSGADLSGIDNFSLWFTDEASASDSQVKPNSNTSKNIRILAAFADAGVPKKKLVPILPFYGKSFYKASGLGSSHQGAGSGNDGVLQYKEIMDKFNKKDAYSVSFDESSKSEVAVSDNETIVFNGIPSVKAITEAVESNGYGGVAAFDISGDRREPIISLLVTIGQVLRPQVDYKKKKK
ncbi:MAG: glycoside hydrolase family 18 protein [Fibromonadaceae bacterium]|jgi:GH18 family chitinase|nr:glycoside hydrolase family 18 protein [Fibromonadaceae bacterium]